MGGDVWSPDEARDTLRRGLEALGLPRDEGRIARLLRHIEEIRLFNPAFKLVGDPIGSIAARHTLDSLAGARLVEEAVRSRGGAAKVADLGSGAGFPGIPLAIMLPDVSFTLVERMGRRCGFLRNAILATGLEGRTALLCEDARAVRQKFALVVMRAFRPLAEAAGEALRLLEDGGAILAWKGRERTLEDEIAALEARFPGVFDVRATAVEVPFTEGTRRLCLLSKRS